jgi:hypothetical protein
MFPFTTPIGTGIPPGASVHLRVSLNKSLPPLPEASLNLGE